MNVQIKNVPEPIHDELRRRAAQRGISQRDYVLELIRRDQDVPTVEDWQAHLRQLPRIRTGLSGAELVRQAREERDRELDERLRRVSDR